VITSLFHYSTAARHSPFPVDRLSHNKGLRGHGWSSNVQKYEQVFESGQLVVATALGQLEIS
jgi:hypothetical protein